LLWRSFRQMDASLLDLGPTKAPDDESLLLFLRSLRQMDGSLLELGDERAHDSTILSRSLRQIDGSLLDVDVFDPMLPPPFMGCAKESSPQSQEEPSNVELE